MIILLSSTVGIYEYLKFKKNKLALEQKKMYDIIISKGSIDKDPYGRTISNYVVKKFCQIANKYSINIDTITDNEFDFIYKKYVKYIIDKNNFQNK